MEFRQTLSIYEQIARMLEDNVIAGAYGEGDRLPSVRALAADVQVNPNTVQRTFQTLQSDGVVAKERGVGYFVADGARDQILRRRRRSYTTEVLPEQFRQLSLLGFGVDEVAAAYAAYLEREASNSDSPAPARG